MSNSHEHDAHTAPAQGEGFPTKAPGQSWPSPTPAPSLAELEANAAPVRNATAGDVEHSGAVEHTATAPEAVEPSVEPKRRGPGRPRIPCFKKLHVSFDEPAYRSLLVVAEVLRAYGRQGTMSQALRFAVDLSARTLAPDTTLIRATDMTPEIARLMRKAAESR